MSYENDDRIMQVYEHYKSGIARIEKEYGYGHKLAKKNRYIFEQVELMKAFIEALDWVISGNGTTVTEAWKLPKVDL